MFLIDFEYDGRMLSDFGFMICNITTNSGVETVSAGSNITWNTVTSNTGVNLKYFLRFNHMVISRNSCSCI